MTLRARILTLCAVAAWMGACSSGEDVGGTTDDMRPVTGTAGRAAAGSGGAGGIAAVGGSTTPLAGRGTVGAAGAPTPPPPPPPPPMGAAGMGPVAPPPAGGMAPPPPAGMGGMMMPPPPAGPPGTWPAADPGKAGPFMTTMESNVGPGMAFTMWRPRELTQRHPVITWGNGTGTTPPTYRSQLNLYASHGFIVIASNSMNVGQGNPPPMLDGVTWVLAQDMLESSPLYQKVDRDRIGATGHSQGAFATSRAGMDPRIKTIAPIQSLGGSRGFHGPVLALCGTGDMIVPCSGNLRSWMGITDQPAMYAELKTADHTNWIFSAGGSFNPYHVITNAWFRVHLMNDTALRPMFYGECSVCKDTATWATMRKMMDQ